jgi:hypothetical protein
MSTLFSFNIKFSYANFYNLLIFKLI